jgi:hypothetical protein
MNVKIIIGCSALALLGGCAVNPEPLTPSEIDTSAQKNWDTVDAEQEPVGAPIDLYEAMARGRSLWRARVMQGATISLAQARSR